LGRLELSRDFDDWADVIKALAVLQTDAMREAATNEPHGPKYRSTIALKLRLYGFDHIHKSTRSFLLKKIAPDLDTMIAWRARQPPDKQIELNNPRTVLARWKSTLRLGGLPDRGADPGGETPSPPLIHLDAAWAAASSDQRRNLFDRLGRDGICAAMSAQIREQLEEHLLGQQVKTADASSSFAVTLTRILQHALSSTSENDRAQVIPRIEAKLKANRRTLHNVVIAIADTGPARKKKAQSPRSGRK
jgi:hypothetical protein